MKQRRATITLLLLLAVLALSIAYAVIANQNLEVVGNFITTTSDDNFNVQFTGTPTIDGEGTTIAAINSSDNKKATIQISGLTTAGQTATATYTIINQSPSNIIAKLTKNVVHSNSTWFSVEAELSQDTIDTMENNTATLTIRVTLLKTPVTDKDVQNAKDTITVTIGAEAQ